MNFSRFGADKELDVLLGDLECKGTESSLFFCDHPGVGFPQCTTNQRTAGLICGISPGR